LEVETSNVDTGQNKRGRDKEEALRDAVLEDITQEQRDRKAVKSDDAGIPKHLWEDQLLGDVEGQEWDDAKLKKVRRFSGWLCTMMLRWWKKKVTTLYIAWAKDKYALTDVTSKVDWVELHDSKFIWTKEGAGNYRGWWKQRFLTTHQD
jgi:hypothetical protein